MLILRPEETHLLTLLCTCQSENVALAQELAQGLNINLLALLEQEGFVDLGLENFNAHTWAYFANKEARFNQLEGQNLRALKYFKHIEVLSFENCRFQTVSGIEFLPNLREFSFTEGLIVDFSGIAKVSKSLKKMTLQLEDNKKMTQVRKHLKNLLWCEYVPQLEYLNCDYNQGITSLEGIGYLQKLKYLSLSDCNLKSLQGIELCKTLEILYVAKNKLEALYPLYQLPALKKVNITKNSLLPKTMLRNYRLEYQDKIIILSNKV
jgi:hypothetical protein